MGLLGDAERKSIEPIAARSCADVEKVSAVHQQLQHFVVDSPWGDHEVRLGAARFVLEGLTAREPIETWQIDDTGFLKQGSHSVGVQRQYTGSAGKIANCQIGVSLSVATRTEQVPIDFELYLPKSWTESQELREEGHIPENVTFKTKVEQACEMICRAVADGIPRGVVLTDSFYGDEPSFRAAVRSQGLDYAVGIKSDNRVWKLGRRGRPCAEPLTVAQLARSLKPKRFRRVTWRQGVRAPLSSLFAMQRVTPAYRAAGEDLASRESVWLIVERPDELPERCQLLRDRRLSSALAQLLAHPLFQRRDRRQQARERLALLRFIGPVGDIERALDASPEEELGTDPLGNLFWLDALHLRGAGQQLPSRSPQ